ncbi:YugN family protein [Alteribacillus iranensis]|uniref:YugN-like family protein n=1 Tax=Alteribacillus iranensis TaxID=930128 RepID=A0A1I2B720_9BACI|nr:YugN family protein [Alteribacillus iranensis]SFE51103.1 YugN-like family protein [Alteribacillus iranensis]
MLTLETELEGKHGAFGTVHHILQQHGFELGDNWDFDNGCFDAVISQEGPESMYIRLPFKVVEGMLDQPRAEIVFGTPYVIKHIVNYGLDKDDDSLQTALGFNQFQTPIDKDGNIEQEQKWEEVGKDVVSKVLRYIPVTEGDEAEIDEENTEEELEAEKR